MAKIYLDELETASSIYKDSFLSQDIGTSENVSVIINEFVNDTKSKLKGSMWDAVRGKMGEFQNAFSSFGKVSDSFCTAIETAVKMLSDVVGEDCNYDYLDDSLLEGLRTTLKELEAKLAVLKQGETVTSKDEKGKETTTTKYNNAEISKCEAEIAKTNALIAKTEAFQEAYKKATALIDEAYQEVVSFASSIDNIEVSVKIAYDGK